MIEFSDFSDCSAGSQNRKVKLAKNIEYILHRQKECKTMDAFLDAMKNILLHIKILVLLQYSFS
jgi:hypothetical protein